jgi:hypothetical protein
MKTKFWTLILFLTPQRMTFPQKGTFLMFSVFFLHKNENISGVLSFKIKFSSKIDPPYPTICITGTGTFSLLQWGKPFKVSKMFVSILFVDPMTITGAYVIHIL